MSRALTAMVAAVLGLAGSLAASLFLFHAAENALDRVLDERLRAAGESAALLLGAPGAHEGQLRALMKTHALDAAYLLDRSLNVTADTGGRHGQPADFLRLDTDRVQRAFEGFSSVGPGYSLGDLAVTTGYFPVRAADGPVSAVLAFEAGQAFAAPRLDLSRARTAAVLLSVLGAVALGLVAARWTAMERVRRANAEQVARGESIARMGAMVAHEIRNPLGILRAGAELMRERAGSAMPDWQRTLLEEMLGEVERLRRLTEDFLCLGTPERPLASAPLELAPVLLDSVRGAESTFRDLRIDCQLARLPPVRGDPHRLRQVFANLLANAAQAQQERGTVEVRAQSDGDFARIRIHDGGPGLTAEVRQRLFDPFLTTKAGGSGLGLPIARMLVTRHGGTLAVLDDGRPGTTFEISLPVDPGGGVWPGSS
ncbi:MAG TPA: HAMP domain-containing sensor histidine kinase [Myxococcales bacterium]|jgi:two-component system OmpR family sensor kinase|nr:HAMP domain-containing sensor histidine kinase [Myxococcales bacterium]